MKFVQQSNIFGEIIAPPSKSIIQRKMLAEYLCGNYNFPIINSLPDDVQSMHKALLSLTNNDSIVDLGESGFCLRVLPVLASLTKVNIQYSSTGNLFKRPIISHLKSINLNAIFTSKNVSEQILKVDGSLESGVFHIDGNITSQLLTALLFSLPILHNDSTIYVSNLKSKAYINLTIEILKTYSIIVSHTDYEVFHIKGGQVFKNVENYSEGDWSGSSFIIAGAAIASKSGITINNLNPSSIQADASILNLMEKCGIKFCLDNSRKSLIINKSNIHNFEFDFSDCPDLIPAIIPIAINSDDNCVCYGVSRLKFKESDRISALISEYNKCGIKIELIDDKLIIYPGDFIGSVVDSHNDHRIVMSLAIAALAGRGKLAISDYGCVSKSYPNFWIDIINLGANCYE